MIDINKYSNSFQVDLRGVMKTVHRFTEEGEGEHMGNMDISYLNESFILKEENLQENINKSVLKYLEENFYNADIQEECLFISDNNTIVFNLIEDNDSNTIKGIGSFKGGMFISDYMMILEINGIEVEHKDLIEIFSKAEYFE